MGGFELFGQKGLFGFAQYVRFESQEFGEGDSEVRQEVTLQKILHPCVVDGLDFRVQPADRGGEFGADVDVTAVESLNVAVAQVFGLPEHHVVTEFFREQAGAAVDEFHGFGEFGGGFAECAPVGGGFGNGGFEFFEIRFPGLIVGVEFGEIPGVFFGDFAALRDFGGGRAFGGHGCSLFF